MFVPKMNSLLLDFLPGTMIICEKFLYVNVSIFCCSIKYPSKLTLPESKHSSRRCVFVGKHFFKVFFFNIGQPLL